MKELKECLVCGGVLYKYMDLGVMPLVNNLKECLKYPLLVNECYVCTHKQLSIAVDPNILYSDYLYQTGTSSKHINFFMDFVYDLEIPKGKALDIGCNDCTLLEELTDVGWKCLGIDPSARGNTRIRTIKDFFPSGKIKGKFDLITAYNVFAHNDNPHEFLLAMKVLLKENGRIYILTTPARLDNFYHEHISYFTPSSMMKLIRMCNLELKSFKIVKMHGGSQLFEIGHIENRQIKTPDLSRLGNVAYGASASEIVLFNLYQIVPEYVVDG